MLHLIGSGLCIPESPVIEANVRIELTHSRVATDRLTTCLIRRVARLLSGPDRRYFKDPASGPVGSVGIEPTAPRFQSAAACLD